MNRLDRQVCKLSKRRIEDFVLSSSNLWELPLELQPPQYAFIENGELSSVYVSKETSDFGIGTSIAQSIFDLCGSWNSPPDGIILWFTENDNRMIEESTPYSTHVYVAYGVGYAKEVELELYSINTVTHKLES